MKTNQNIATYLCREDLLEVLPTRYKLEVFTTYPFRRRGGGGGGGGG